MAEIISDEILNDNNGENSNSNSTGNNSNNSTNEKIEKHANTKMCLMVAIATMIGENKTQKIVKAIEKDDGKKLDELTHDLEPPALYAILAYALRKEPKTLNTCSKLLIQTATRSWMGTNKAAPFGGHGAYVSGAGPHRIGFEVGILSETEGHSDCHSGFGAYITLEHVQTEKLAKLKTKTLG